MTKLSIVLLVALIFSALYLVAVQYDSRRVFTELEQARVHAEQLDVEHARLDVERRAQARSLRVATLAQDQLSMRPITPSITEYVTVPASTPAQENGVLSGPGVPQSDPAPAPATTVEGAK